MKDSLVKLQRIHELSGPAALFGVIPTSLHEFALSNGKINVTKFKELAESQDMVDVAEALWCCRCLMHSLISYETPDLGHTILRHITLVNQIVGTYRRANDERPLRTEYTFLKEAILHGADTNLNMFLTRMEASKSEFGSRTQDNMRRLLYNLEKIGFDSTTMKVLQYKTIIMKLAA